MMETIGEMKKRELFHRVTARTIALITLGLLAAHGAIAQKVTVEFDRAADFSKYKTFAIRERQLNSRNPL